MHIKRLAVAENGRRYYIKDKNVSFHTNEGRISREDMDKDIIQTKNGEHIHLYEPVFKDNFQMIKKPAAVINPKDAGMIIAYTALTKNSIVIDAGAGSGALTSTMAVLCKRVYSYDVNEKHVKAVKQTIKDLELDNATCEFGDITKITPPEKVDMMTIDIPEPSEVMETARKALKPGGYLVLYTPQITQALRAVEKLDQDFHHENTCEIIKRNWEVSERKLRPSHTMLGHTAFLTFIRFYPKLVEVKKRGPKMDPKKQARLERAKHRHDASQAEKEQVMGDFF